MIKSALPLKNEQTLSRQSLLVSNQFLIATYITQRTTNMEYFRSKHTLTGTVKQIDEVNIALL